jgi:uncharacterized membrane protein YesL
MRNFDAGLGVLEVDIELQVLEQPEVKMMGILLVDKFIKKTVEKKIIIIISFFNFFFYINVAGLFFFCMCCSSHFAGKIIYNSRI